jgi:predicted  nucleic acid-binding Zn-ribbon protein
MTTDTKNRNEFLNDRQEAMRRVVNRLNQWQAEIDKLRAQADAAEAGARKAYYDKIDDLQTEINSAQKRAQELRGAGEDAWQKIQLGAEKALDELGNALQQAKDELK